ncbi:hypothetical protein M405DRAFT_821521, partial [Rhizopogon salebrosus TDB-379]
HAEALLVYLTVRMVRFAWRRDIGKEAKIMHKVKFATEFDPLDIVTDELKSKLAPPSRKNALSGGKCASTQKSRGKPPLSSSCRPEQGTSPNTEVIADVEMAPAGEVPEDLEEESVYRTREG